MNNALRSLLPKDMRLVPCVMTPEMEAAWFTAPRHRDESGAITFQLAYAAMIGAAPPVQVPIDLDEDFDQVGALRAENDRLRSLLGEKLNAETVLQELRMKPGELFAEFEGGAAGVLIHCLGDMFTESKAPNYLDMRFDYKGEAIAVLIQRVSGLTPAQRVVVAEARAEAAEAKVAAFKQCMDLWGSWHDGCFYYNDIAAPELGAALNEGGE